MKTKSIKCNFKNSRGDTLDARIDMPADDEKQHEEEFHYFLPLFHLQQRNDHHFSPKPSTCRERLSLYCVSILPVWVIVKVIFHPAHFRRRRMTCASAISFLKENYQHPAYLMGHSLGGTTALSIAQEYDFVKGVVTVASPSEPGHVLHHFGHTLTLLEQGIPASFEVAGQYFDIEPGFVDDVCNIEMHSCLAQLEKPVLVFNIDNDALVDESNADEIQQWVKGDVTLIDVTGTDHLLTNKEAVEMVAGDIVKWIDLIE